MTLALALASLSPAHACGGFFCNSEEPVVQNAERIVFAVDLEEQYVETHVQVEYEGPADEFAWIVPVQAAPDLFLSSDVLFSTVGTQLQPQFETVFEDEGRCKHPVHISLPCIACSDFAIAPSEDIDFAEEQNGVDVVGRDLVGPYDTVTLQADSIEALMQWLEDNDYAIPSTAADAIAPYVSEDGYFVALKLTKGADAGDLAPLAFRYTGDTPAVPIQLTSVATAPDLRLEVTVFGDHRAVPESYLHVVINDAAIDWFGGAQNYNDVITRAADEAGGHAFATDYAGPSSFIVVDDFDFVDLDALATASSPSEWIEMVQSSGIFGTSEVFSAFEAAVPVAAGFDAQSVYNCPSCFEGDDWLDGEWNAATATQIFDERIVAPRKAIEDLVAKHPYATRMTSSISASEMTVDPTFVFNAEMGDVQRIRRATVVYECNGKYRRRASRRLELPSGLVVRIPSLRWFENEGITETEYLAELGQVSAGKIERTGEGAPEVMVDLTLDLEDQVRFFNENGPLGKACGCQSNDSLLSGGAFALLGLLALRRRR